jgi:type 1 glutamine amidotransferase
MSSARQAIVVRGGWEGHSPVEATDRFIPFLEKHDFTVEVHEGPEVYADADKLAATDLVLQCYTQGVASDEQVLGLSKAVAAGTGLAGWHGGIVDSYRGSPDYLI